MLLQLASSYPGGAAGVTPAQALEQQQKANATMIELEERRIEKMKRRQVWMFVVERHGRSL